MMDTNPAQILILCNLCTKRYAENEEFTFDKAWNPEFLPGPGDIAVLAAPMFHELRFPERVSVAQRKKCEGCGATVYVASSSQWLLDMKARIEGG